METLKMQDSLTETNVTAERIFTKFWFLGKFNEIWIYSFLGYEVVLIGSVLLALRLSALPLT
jgi:hypothetical protein